MEEKINVVAKDSGEVPERKIPGPDPLLDTGPRGGVAPKELACIEKLLAVDWKGRRGEPMTAAELLEIGAAAFEPLFHEPPVGPVPEYLRPHLWVHGCVAEYEEKFDELDRWKALELHRWLEDRVGGKWYIGAKVYELRAQRDRAGAREKFWFRLVEDQTGCADSGDNES